MTDKKVWLVTGASRGIGAAVARRIIKGGDRVAILARGTEVHTLAEELGEDCLACQADISQRESVNAAVAQILEKWQRLDRVINNAGTHKGGKIGRLKLENWQQVLDVNLTGTLNVITACAEHMEQGSSIVNIGAVVGFRGFPGDSAYAASKSGVAGLTRALAIEFAARGITCNLVIPGLVLTEMTEELSEKALESMRKTIPMGRYGDPDEIAEVIEWVASSRYMTGAFVPADGGLMSSFGIVG
ncbi:MAG: SDR family oxidoreductase [Halioglobus sp.]